MAAELLTAIPAMRSRVAAQRQAGRTVGLVPTMGALHSGHGALVEAARAACEYLVVSIFVNPIQFDQAADFETYARDLESDLAFCTARGVDTVFAPSAREMYPAPQATVVEVTGLQDHLCGRFRPGHFRGVATVVTKLLNIVSPDKAWFGEKDAQQLAIIRRLVADLNLPVQIIPVPTVREHDGLALSSRNQRLSMEERRVAPALFHALAAGRELIRQGSTSPAGICAEVLGLLDGTGMRVDYVEVTDAETMLPVAEITGPVRIAAAVWLGNTRLIDNVYCEHVRQGDTN